MNLKKFCARSKRSLSWRPGRSCIQGRLRSGAGLIYCVERAPVKLLALILESGSWISPMNPDSNMWMLIVALFVILQLLRTENNQTTKMPFSLWFRIILINKKEWTIDTHNSMVESQMHSAKSKGYILYDSIYMAFWKSKTSGARNRFVVVRGWGWGKRLTIKGHGRTFWGNGTVLYSDCSGSYIIVCICQILKNCIVKKVTFTAYKLYLNKNINNLLH